MNEVESWQRASSLITKTLIEYPTLSGFFQAQTVWASIHFESFPVDLKPIFLLRVYKRGMER